MCHWQLFAIFPHLQYKSGFSHRNSFVRIHTYRQLHKREIVHDLDIHMTNYSFEWIWVNRELERFGGLIRSCCMFPSHLASTWWNKNPPRCSLEPAIPVSWTGLDLASLQEFTFASCCMQHCTESVTLLVPNPVSDFHFGLLNVKLIWWKQ